MVTTTPVYGLPYQQGADDPCEADETWCEFVTLANAAMSATKRLLDRVEPAVPAALVGRTEPFAVGTSTVMIPFDTVLLDTDGMVSTDVSDTFVFPRRTGLYRVVANAEYLNDTATVDAYNGFTIATAFGSFPGPIGSGAGWTALGNDAVGIFAPGNNNHYRVAATGWVDAAFLNQSASSAGGFGVLIQPTSGTQTIRKMQMGVYYLREAP